MSVWKCTLKKKHTLKLHDPKLSKRDELIEKINSLENNTYHRSSKENQKLKRAIAMSEKITRWF